MEDVSILNGGGIEYVQDFADQSVQTDNIYLKGMAIEYLLNDAEKIVTEVTKIQGFAIELIDYPLYSFEITELTL